MIGFLLGLLLWMLGHGPTPAPHGVMVSPAAPAPASVVVRGDEPRTPGRHPGDAVPPARSSAPAAAPTVADPGPVQGPGEVIGRQLDGPGGVVCAVTDAAGDVSCPGPAPAGP